MSKLMVLLLFRAGFQYIISAESEFGFMGV
jgi:hypothetical protein